MQLKNKNQKVQKRCNEMKDKKTQDAANKDAMRKQ